MEVKLKDTGYISQESWLTGEKIGALRVKHLNFSTGGIDEEILIYDHTKPEHHVPIWRGTLKDLIKKVQEPLPAPKVVENEDGNNTMPDLGEIVAQEVDGIVDTMFTGNIYVRPRLTATGEVHVAQEYDTIVQIPFVGEGSARGLAKQIAGLKGENKCLENDG